MAIEYGAGADIIAPIVTPATLAGLGVAGIIYT